MSPVLVPVYWTSHRPGGFTPAFSVLWRAPKRIFLVSNPWPLCRLPVEVAK